MFFDLLHLGSGLQALHYWLLCLFGILGTIQGVATRYQRQDLQWFEGRTGYFFSAIVVAASFIWFFAVDEEAFIPGLAGGELFTLFIVALVAAVPLTRVIAGVVKQTRALVAELQAAQEEEPTL